MKKIVLFLVAVLMIVTLSACATNKTASIAVKDQPSMFVEVEETRSWRIVYHKDTKVMYAVQNGGVYSYGAFTVLVNADGSPMLWEE